MPKKSVTMILLIALIITGCAVPPPPKAPIVPELLEAHLEEFNPDTLSKLIREKITKSSEKNLFMCRSELINVISPIQTFYQQREFFPAWAGNNGEFRLADDLLERIKNCYEHALDSENYHFNTISILLKIIRESRGALDLICYDTAADLDILLTDAFFLYSSHLLFGLVDPKIVHVKGEASEPDIDLSSVLDIALKDRGIGKILENLSPQQQEYLYLQSALKKYQELSSKTDPLRVPVGETLRYGDFHDRVRILRNRLIFFGDLKATETLNPNFFDADLEKAVKSFQFRHGLLVDGFAGRQTIAALNISPKTRLRQIELNMERWRWLPRDLGTKYILVNIADFKLSVVEHGQAIVEMRVVVGKHYQETPVFSAKMQFLVINPVWKVPIKLAIRDLAPKICSDPGYLAARKMKVYKNWQRNSAEIDPALISWCTLTPESYFPYKLQQAAGPHNPLGKIKFIFPNKYAVYFHDSPDKLLFDKNQRDFSSGCIRVEKPYLLAEYLLKSDPHWSKAAVSNLFKSSATKYILLNEQIPVHLVYLDAWADSDGVIHFRNDIYRQDRILDNALQESPLLRELSESEPQAKSSCHGWVSWPVSETPGS